MRGHVVSWASVAARSVRSILLKQSGAAAAASVRRHELRNIAHAASLDSFRYRF